MDEPSWQREEDLENLETERLIDEQGERESQQMYINRWEGDTLGIEDGRPGCAWVADPRSGWFLAMPESWSIGLWIGVRVATLIVIALLAFTVRYCVGEQRAQEILRESGGYGQHTPSNGAH